MTETARAQEISKLEESFRLGVVGTIGLVLSIIAPMFLSKEEWFKPYWLPCFWLGVAVFIICIALSIEIALSAYWKYGTFKTAGTFAFSTLILSANISAATAINSVFGISASALPYTFSVMTAAKLIILLKPLFIGLCFVGVFALLASIIDWYKVGFPRYIPLIVAIGGIIGGGYPWHMINKYLNSEELPLKIYTTAHKLDFSSKYNCTNIKKGHTVIFIGASQDRVLLDTDPDVEEDVSKYVYSTKANSPIDVPESFEIVECAAKKEALHEQPEQAQTKQEDQGTL